MHYIMLLHTSCSNIAHPTCNIYHMIWYKAFSSKSLRGPQLSPPPIYLNIFVVVETYYDLENSVVAATVQDDAVLLLKVLLQVLSWQQYAVLSDLCYVNIWKKIQQIIHIALKKCELWPLKFLLIWMMTMQLAKSLQIKIQSINLGCIPVEKSIYYHGLWMLVTVINIFFSMLQSIYIFSFLMLFTI
jgi:hypothetical protein